MTKNKEQKIDKLNLNIEKLQEILVPLVKEMFAKKEICFTSDFYKPSETGYNWLLKNNLKGKFLCDFYKENPVWYCNLSKKIADDYQRVIEQYFKITNESKENLMKNANDELFGNLYK